MAELQQQQVVGLHSDGATVNSPRRNHSSLDATASTSMATALAAGPRAQGGIELPIMVAIHRAHGYDEHHLRCQSSGDPGSSSGPPTAKKMETIARRLNREFTRTRAAADLDGRAAELTATRCRHPRTKKEREGRETEEKRTAPELRRRRRREIGEGRRRGMSRLGLKDWGSWACVQKRIFFVFVHKLN